MPSVYAKQSLACARWSANGRGAQSSRSAPRARSQSHHAFAACALPAMFFGERARIALLRDGTGSVDGPVGPEFESQTLDQAAAGRPASRGRNRQSCQPGASPLHFCELTLSLKSDAADRRACSASIKEYGSPVHCSAMVKRAIGASMCRHRCAVRQLPLLLCGVAWQTMIARGRFMDGELAGPRLSTLSTLPLAR